MSRIGKVPVIIPDKAKVSVKDGLVSIEGPKGKASRQFDPAVTTITVDGNHIHCAPVGDSRHAGAMHGTVRSLIAGMIKGVTEGYSESLEIQGVGFKATLKGKVLDLALGYSHPILYPIPEGIIVTVGETPQKNPLIKIDGFDKKMVGQVAADIYSFYKVEPYKGKGVRILGRHIRRKEGKKTA